MKQLISHALIMVIFSSYANAVSRYPSTWWKPVPESERKSWEVLPQDAKAGEVILSKRNELGVFSNLALAPFTYDGKHYASVEGLWQMLKYPEVKDKSDPRNTLKYPYKRKDIPAMHGFDSKKAGDIANKKMKKLGIKWVSYKGKRFNYKDKASGSDYHYKMIYQAIYNKVLQNKKIKKLLISTGDLILRPDHNIRKGSPKSYYYNKILMDIRSRL